MEDFKPSEMPIIEPGNPVWQTIEAWVRMNLSRLRRQRENGVADIRKLDTALGGIIAMKALLDLPAQIKQARMHEPVMCDDFGIPGLDTDNT